MKTFEEIKEARNNICKKIAEGGLSREQLALLAGMLQGLIWSADDKSCSTIERVLAGELLAKPFEQN